MEAAPETAVLAERVKNQGETLLRIEKKLDQFADDHEKRLRENTSDITGLTGRVKELEDAESDAERRIRDLEKAVWSAGGVGVVVGILVPIAIKLLFP